MKKKEQAMNEEILIDVKNVNKSFGKRKVIDNLNLRVCTGDVYGFLGPNGSGKTTTIRMILGLVFPQSGQIHVNGHDIRTNYTDAIRDVGAIVENPSAFLYLSGRQNLQLRANLYKDIPASRIDEVLQIVDLQDRAKDKVRTYSLGMKQRLGIAMALLNNPKIVFLDEPTNGLDPQGMKDTKELIVRLAKENGITFFISSHLLNEVEQICTKVGILMSGKLIKQGSVKELLSSNTDIFEVVTADIELAVSLLKEAAYVKSIQTKNDGIVVEIDKNTFSQLNGLLMTHQVTVTSISQQEKSLEQLFLELTSGGEKHV